MFWMFFQTLFMVNCTSSNSLWIKMSSVTNLYLHVLFVHVVTDVVNAVFGEAAGVDVELWHQVALRRDGRLLPEGRLHVLAPLIALRVGDEGQDRLPALPVELLQPVVVQVPSGENLLHLVVLGNHGELPL